MPSPVLTLYNYPAVPGTDDAALISVPIQYRGLVEVYDTNSVNVTDYLVNNEILIFRRQFHGWIVATHSAARFTSRTHAATKWKVTERYYPMSVNFNAGETPIFFARVIDSETQTPLTTNDVGSISLTIYSYSRNNIRSSEGTGYTPIDDWEDVPMTVADVVDNNPQLDPRCGFAPNLIFEPNTLTNNPFKTPGQYRAIFTITPAEGNRIPVIIDFKTS